MRKLEGLLSYISAEPRMVLKADVGNFTLGAVLRTKLILFYIPFDQRKATINENQFESCIDHMKRFDPLSSIFFSGSWLSDSRE